MLLGLTIDPEGKVGPPVWTHWTVSPAYWGTFPFKTAVVIVGSQNLIFLLLTMASVMSWVAGGTVMVTSSFPLAHGPATVQRNT